MPRESTKVKVILLTQKKRDFGWGAGEKFRVRTCLTVNWWEAKRRVSPCLSLPQGRKSPPGVRDTLLAGWGRGG